MRLKTALAINGKDHSPAGLEIRRSKVEGRKKAEIRSPKAEVEEQEAARNPCAHAEDRQNHGRTES